MGKGDHKAQEIDVEEAEDEKPYEDLWCRGSELHIRLFDDDKGGVSAVVERVPCELMEGDCSDYGHLVTMQDTNKKERAAAQLVRRGMLLNASFAKPGSALLQV